MCKSFVQAKGGGASAPLLFGPADLGDIIMFCQVVQVAIKILQKIGANEKFILAEISLMINV